MTLTCPVQWHCCSHQTYCRGPDSLSKHSTFAQTNLQASLQMHGLTYPPVDSALMHTYISHLTSVGLIPRPTRGQQNGKFVFLLHAPHFTWDVRRKAFKMLFKYLKAWDYLEDLGTDGRIIVQWIHLKISWFPHSVTSQGCDNEPSGLAITGLRGCS